MIQQLLAEAGADPVRRLPVPADGVGVEAPADWASMRSGENYLGYGRTENFASLGTAFGGAQDYALPAGLRLNSWALGGTWAVGRQATVSHEAGARIAYRFHARDLHLVMGPATAGEPVRFRATLDGRPPDTAHGSDLDGRGEGTVSWPRLHQLVRQPGPVADRTLEITFLDPGAALYSVTFG